MRIKLFEQHDPSIGECVFIITGKYDDGHKRLYVSPIIDTMRCVNGPDKVRVNADNMILIKKNGDDFVGSNFNVSLSFKISF